MRLLLGIVLSPSPVVSCFAKIEGAHREQLNHMHQALRLKSFESKRKAGMFEEIISILFNV